MCYDNYLSLFVLFRNVVFCDEIHLVTKINCNYYMGTHRLFFSHSTSQWHKYGFRVLYFWKTKVMNVKTYYNLRFLLYTPVSAMFQHNLPVFKQNLDGCMWKSAIIYTLLFLLFHALLFIKYFFGSFFFFYLRASLWTYSNKIFFWHDTNWHFLFKAHDHTAACSIIHMCDVLFVVWLK